MADFDLAVIGAGAGGVRAAQLATDAGARVAICEDGRIGGAELGRGSIAKKLLLDGVSLADAFADAPSFGWTVGSPPFDWGRLVAAKNREIERLSGLYAEAMRSTNISIFSGQARLIDGRTIGVGEQTLTAEKILLATGSYPLRPPIPGAEHAITSDEALDLMRLPKHMVIIGGGYIGVEFAGIFSALGVAVTLIVRSDGVLRGFDQDLREAMAQGMQRNGVNLLQRAVVAAIHREGRGFSIELTDGEKIPAELVLLATGRVPRTAGMNLEEAGVTFNRKGAVIVDASQQTSVAGVFAIGDVTDRANFAPVALAEAECFVESQFKGTPKQMKYDLVPTAIFGRPPLATVGLSEAKARASHVLIDVYKTRFRPLRHAVSGRDQRVMMKLVVDTATDRVLGCHMVGEGAPEIMQGFAVALNCGATKAQFDATLSIHPTNAEEFVNLRHRS
jgi:glutathione reductase (NADPH)